MERCWGAQAMRAGTQVNSIMCTKSSPIPKGTCTPEKWRRGGALKNSFCYSGDLQELSFQALEFWREESAVSTVNQKQILRSSTPTHASGARWGPRLRSG